MTFDRNEITTHTNFSPNIKYIKELIAKYVEKNVPVIITDRMSHPEFPHHLSIAYGLKGYSLSTSVMREMCEDVEDECLRISR